MQYLLYVLFLLLVACDDSTSGRNDTDTVNSFVDWPQTGLPRLEINSLMEIEDKENWIEASLKLDSVEYSGFIKGRGNITWTYPKKPYAIRLIEKESLLGMPKAKNWVLLANYKDRTLLRNHLAFEIARNTDLEWTPQGRFVDVVLNGNFIGNYYLSEKVEIDRNRVNIADDGVLLEFDWYYDGEKKFRSSIFDLPINLKSSGELTESRISYISTYVDTVEHILSKQWEGNITDYLDLESFVDFFIVIELTENLEPAFPKSVFMYKRKNDKIKAGPVWDFDWSTFRPGILKLRNRKAIWYEPLLHDKYFVQLLKERWNAFKPKFIGLISFIDSSKIKISQSGYYDFSIWDTTGIQKSLDEYDQEYVDGLDSLKSTYLNRINILDSLFESIK